ncbi:hypothetical protein [Alkalihalobacillus sp. R86527]|uniref:hypothetical protein n=1 Tax=Alkalihalobacillus sp. R86527 TaxID=3093863 RepID=UPI00366EB07B
MTISKEEQFVNKWSKIRGMGKWKYILLQGVLVGGSVFLFVNVCIDFIFSEEYKRISEYIMTSLLFGILFGAGTWYYSENKYKKYNETS